MTPLKRSRIALPKEEYKALCNQVHRRDGWKCRTLYCGARTNLHAHHIIYRSRGGDDASWNMITLCERCHNAVHDRYLVILPLIKEVINGKARYEDIIDADKGVQWQFNDGWHPRASQSRVKSKLKRRWTT